MKKGRIEAFSDGVIAIIITIMVLELKVPHEKSRLVDLLALWPVFLSYVLSFIYVGIYWNNHHHMFTVVNKVNGAVLWANMHLLFWLSIIPLLLLGWERTILHQHPWRCMALCC
ncbi:TMEM175 family protein [Pedobacter sp. UC225_65]|uniref:TMEM175 family protein n=1 Tax=Pedobacter sp. UC225_65 TaxID=3350173 RepID=UPI00366C00C7